MPKRAAQRTDRTEPASLPEVLIPPGQAEESQKAAYWIDLLGNVEQLKAATETTDFFVLVQEFPAAVWDRLTIYLYRLSDDNGVLLKNADDKPHYIKVLRQPLTEEFVAKNWGGGKYQAWLKIDNKEVLRKHTFRIDGEPKLQPGQTIQIEGKSVPLGTTVAAPPVAPATDLATALDASRKATDSAMNVLAHASETAIDMVKAQSAQTSAPQKSSVSELVEIAKALQVLQPPQPQQKDSMAAALEIVDRLDAMAARRNPLPEKEPEGAMEAGLSLVERLTGKAIPDLMKPRSSPVESDSYGWVAPIVNAVQSFIGQLPTIMHEARLSRDMEFRRQIWLRTAKPDTAPPPELLANNPAPQNRQPQPAAPQPQPRVQPGKPDPMQLANILVQMICHGFDKNPRMGYQTAAAIDSLYGDAVESLGLEKFLADEAALTEYVKGVPQLAERSQDARWAKFQSDFLDYTAERWPAEDQDGVELDVAKGPQPVA